MLHTLLSQCISLYLVYPVCPSAGISDAKNYRLALLEGGRGVSEVRIRLHCLECCVYVHACGATVSVLTVSERVDIF